ncbi:MAG: hypothetical protein R3247_03470 [Rhodothermales bacterium]|nr:hypothetical protein [Rhodothermales bacterium]
MRGFAAGLVLLMALGLAAVPAAAQTVPFGSADDPREQIQDQWWRRESQFYAVGGLSLIAAQWRGAGTLGLDLVTRPLTAHLEGTLRAGVLGEYGPDLDESYDLLRLVSFARYNPPQGGPLHLRAGLVDRMRLGTGHVVNFFSSSTAWDERTVGAEAAYFGRQLEVGGFTDNVLLDGVAGGRVGVRPLFFSDRLPLRTLQFGGAYVTDLAPRLPDGPPRLEAYNVDARFDLFSAGGFEFSPYLSYAWYRHAGRGIGFGADLGAEEFADVLSFRLRLGLFYNGEGFIPGYVGPFYTLHNRQARIVDSGSDLGDPQATDFVGTLLDAGRGGNDLWTELRVLVNRRFEFWYSFRRHNGTQRLSELNLRLFLRRADQLRFEVGIDRGRLGGFFTIFNDMDDHSALVFGTDYRLFGAAWLFLRSRYSYERIDPGDDHAQRFLVQRRFEPMTGLRIGF